MWATVPGTVTMTRPHSQFFNPQDSQETKFNGQSRLSNNVQVDGLDNNHKTGLLTVLIPSAEAIDSVNVSTSNFDAEFGRAGGSVTTVVLKSGTNQLKGTAFFFGNSEATQARNFFASANARKPATKYQQFGATLGGRAKTRLLFALPAPGGQPRASSPHREPPSDGATATSHRLDDHLRPGHG